MTVLWAVLAASLTLLVLGHWARQVVPEKWARDREAVQGTQHALHDLERRKVQVMEREITLRERMAEKPDASAVIPEDLEGRVTAWEDTWAQENERQTLLSLYAQYRDWDKVRQRLAPLNVGQVEVSSRDAMVQ